MSTSEAQLRASKKYHAKFERIYIRISPEKKVAAEKHAAMMNESINSFVLRAIEEAMARDIAKTHSANKAPEQNGRVLDELISEANSLVGGKRDDAHKKESELEI